MPIPKVSLLELNEQSDTLPHVTLLNAVTLRGDSSSVTSCRPTPHCSNSRPEVHDTRMHVFCTF